jgi:chitinase
VLFLLIIGSYIVIFEHHFMLRVHTFVVETHKILIVMLIPRKIIFSLFLLVGVCLYAQQKSFVSSYVRGNFYNRGRVATESLRASDDLILLNVHPNKDGSLSFENPRAFQGKGVTTWEGLIKSIRAEVKGTKAKVRIGASGGQWKAMVADETARTAFAKNIKKVLRQNKLDGIDLDFEWAENAKEYEDYSLAILKMREVLGNKYILSVSLHPVSYKISKEAIAAVDFISLQCYGPSPVRFPVEKYCSDIQMVLKYGIPKEKLVAGVPFYGVTKDNSKKTEAYFSFVQNGLITSPAENEVNYKGEVYVFDGQDNIRVKTRYAKEQGLKGMMSWDLATDLPLDNSQSLLKAMIEELNKE